MSEKLSSGKKVARNLTIFSLFMMFSVLSGVTITNLDIMHLPRAEANLPSNTIFTPILQPFPISNPTLVNYTIKTMANGTEIWSKPVPIMTNMTSNFNNILPSNTTTYPTGITATFNMTGINIDSTFQSAGINVTDYGSVNDTCHLVLLDKFLDPIIMSSPFSCSGSHYVTINQAGLDAMKNNLRIFRLVSMSVNDINGKHITFTSSNGHIDYVPQTYFAQVQNNKVINVIVASQSFVNTLNGTWIQTKPDGSIRGNYAAEGYTYNATRDQFIPPKPNATWILNSTGQWNPP